MKRSVLFITRSALIAALYFALSAALGSLSFGPVQFRLSEALTLLPVIFPEAIPGLAVGCALSNFFFSPYGMYDMLFGVAATLAASVLTYLLRKRLVLAAIPPIVLNALIVPLIWIADGTDAAYMLNAGLILLSEFVTAGLIGVPMTVALKAAFYRSGLIKPSSVKRRSEGTYFPTDKFKAEERDVSGGDIPARCDGDDDEGPEI